jgi:NAD+ kinase
VATIAFVIHPERPEATVIARQAATWLDERGHRAVDVWDPYPSDDTAKGTGDPISELDSTVDLAVSLGGDGTMLRTVALACLHGTPVLGVNLGDLGYLTEVEPDGLGRAVEKSVPGRTIRVAAAIGGRPFVTYAADGLLVATPTGSTAYNLSARGPILSPGLRALVLTPVSPHMLFDRPLVLEPEQWVRLELLGPLPAVLVLDGQSSDSVQPGDAVLCRVGSSPARLVTFGPRDFFSILRARFHLADR